MPYFPGMGQDGAREELKVITQRVDQLIALALKLADENRSLRTSQEQLMAERANLMAKNEQARSRVEAMIHRLKSLEQNG
jgi:cell division protein ZapB